MKSTVYHLTAIVLLFLFACESKKDQAELQQELQSLNLLRGDIALCGSEDARFGTVSFGNSCAENVRDNFNLATALLHSFEYAEAEKVFASIIDADPECLMAYWGVAMSNFHPLWAPPTKDELAKGEKSIAIARSLNSNDERERKYLEAVAVLYDNWNTLDHATRLQNFERAAEKIYLQYPSDIEAAIFYALALRAAADPTNKTFSKQKKAGDILNKLFESQPDHPGIAHYLIHIYDYPELANHALTAARKYASIASSSAHALHMPSHIFTRLGYWEESAQSNINSMTAAKCYAENAEMQGHWDEEIHGLDYLVYAYLQQANDDKAKEQVEYLRSMKVVFPFNNKVAYTMAAAPTRYALERKDWNAALTLDLLPNFPWEKYPWERSIISFGKLLGAIHLNKPAIVDTELSALKENRQLLLDANKMYEANQVNIQIKASEAWIQFSRGKNDEAKQLMSEAADMEDATEKHPVTPGEVVPARELLGDLYMALNEYDDALAAYENNLKRHAGRFNALHGAAVAAQKSGNSEKAKVYLGQLNSQSDFSSIKRPGAEAIKALY